MWLSQVVLVLTVCINFSLMYKYQAVLESDEMFEDCEDNTGTSYGVSSLFDNTGLHFQQEGQSIIIYGPAKMVWDIQPKDRVQ
ncbi:hypothetical protein KR044_012232, partial [Drosophila immigrans]